MKQNNTQAIKFDTPSKLGDFMHQCFLYANFVAVEYQKTDRSPLIACTEKIFYHANEICLILSKMYVMVEIFSSILINKLQENLIDAFPKVAQAPVQIFSLYSHPYKRPPSFLISDVSVIFNWFDIYMGTSKANQ